MLQCEKLLWLDSKMQEKAKLSQPTAMRFSVGVSVGELAKGLFGEHVDTTSVRSDGRLDTTEMRRITASEIANGTQIICEAAFGIDGLYAAVDILRKTVDGYEIYEVKSSTKLKPNHIADAAYQKFVVEQSDITVSKVFVVTLNAEHVRGVEQDIRGLFALHDVTDVVSSHSAAIPQNINRARDVLGAADIPVIEMGRRCGHPYECPYIDFCSGEAKCSEVFELYGGDKKYDWLAGGIRTYDDLLASGEKLSEIQLRQIAHAKNDLPVYINEEEVKLFLSGLRFPLYFLDFETIMPEIPEIVGTSPYTTLPFQFSLHCQKEEGGEPTHFEVLSEQKDPRREIAQALCDQMVLDCTILAYGASFEKRVICSLAEEFPDLCEKLTALSTRIADLHDVFGQGYVYNKRMKGSFSLKSVLPAMFPDNPELDYAQLSVVRDGSQAMGAYSQMLKESGERRSELRQALLEYCKLDTLALVKIYNRLVEYII